MALPADAQAAMQAQARHPVTFVFLDVAGEPITVTNAPYTMTIDGTGDEELDGKTFTALDPRFVALSPIRMKEDGSDTVTAELSGLAGIDDDTMNAIGAKSNWQGRDALVWKGMLNPDNPTQISTLWRWYTGAMSVPRITGDRARQVITLDIEGYLAFLTQASNRTYLMARTFDPADDAGDLSVATANGAGKPGG